MTNAQRTRLEKLAAYLESLPKSYRHFRMDRWMVSQDREQQIHYARHNGGVPSCGTAACAVGHGPAAGVLVPPRFIEPGFVYWRVYAQWLAGAAAYDWCFAGDWVSHDNHHWGAAARIRYLLAQGAPPKGFRQAGRRWRKDYAAYRIDASAIEARRVATAQTGAIHESAVDEVETPNPLALLNPL